MSKADVPARVRRGQWKALVLLVFIGVVNYLDRSALSVANPLIRQEMGLSIADMGLLLSAFAWAYAFCQLPGGAFVDRFGPRYLLGSALVVWSVAQTAVGFVGNFSQFVVARALLGVGEAPTFTSAVRVIREWHAVRHRGMPTSICGSAPSGLGPLIAPPLLTWLMVTFGWRSMFIIMGLIGVIGAVVWMLVYRDIREFDADPTEKAYLSEDGDIDARQPIRFSEWISLFSFRTTWALLIGYSGINYLGWIYLAWLPGYLEIQRHMSVASVGIVAAIPFLFALCGTLSGGWTSEWLMRKGMSPINACRLLLIVALFAGAGCTAGAAYAVSNTMAVAFISAALFFAAIASGQSWGLVSQIAPANCTASLGGMQNCGGYIGGALAPTVTGFVVQATGSFIPALMTGTVVAAIGALAYLTIPNTPIVLPGVADGRRVPAE